MARSANRAPSSTTSTLTTKALRVQLLAIDPTGKKQDGQPTNWQNTLVVRKSIG